MDAERAVERLNGSSLYGFRISVSFSWFKTRTSYWRKVSHSKTHQKPGVGTEDINQSKPREAENNANPSDCSQMIRREEKELERVECFLEEEALSKFNKCAWG
ncbi:hypothetical protein V6N13_029144 [Hibiscus sabdariffa]